MKIALLHKHFNKDHLEEVKAEMAVMGAPVIKAVWLEHLDLFAALEGCHRIRAAKELGLNVIIDEVEYSEEAIEMNEFGDTALISEICDDAAHAEIMEVPQG